MNDQTPALLTVPTELERSDGLTDLIVLIGAAPVVWECANLGIPLWVPAPLAVPLAIWVLTGEAAADLPWIGGLTFALRNAFGLRRAHEWVFAAAYFWRIAAYPVWRSNCVAFYRSVRRRTTRWLRLLNVKTRWLASRGRSWACSTRYNSSHLRAP